MEDDRLHVRYRHGDVQGNGFLDDYSFLTEAYLELHQTTQQISYLKHAIRLTERMMKDFSDKDGSFFFTSNEGETLLVRPKDVYDGVKPAGNSTAVSNLLRLSQLTGRTDYREQAQRNFSTLASEIKSQPTGFASLLSVYTRTLMEPKELIVLTKSYGDVASFLTQLHQRRLPELALLVGEKTELLEIAPFIAAYDSPTQQPTAYLCHDFQCDRPTTNLSELLQKIII